MATTLYLKSSLAQISRGTNTNDQRGSAKDWRAYALSTAVGSGAGSTVTATSVAGTIAGLEFIATGTVLAEWISEPLGAAVTVSGTMTFLFNGSETSGMANGSASFLVQRLDSTGAIASTVVTASHGTELSVSSGSSPSAHSFTATPTSTAFSKGDRIRVVAFVDDNATTGTMASGYTFTLNFDGAAGNTANTYVQFTENLTWQRADPYNTKLTASDGAAYPPRHGSAGACSSDGSIAVVGANAGTNPTYTTGAVYVYSGTNYATEKKLTPSGSTLNGGEFGNSVACSSDGSVIVGGSPASLVASEKGAVYIYSGSNYATEKKLIASDGAATDNFGWSVACSSDGSVVVVGANESDPGGTSNAGAVYIYSGSNYATEKKLVASDKAASDYFGQSVACSSDGSVVVVGANRANPGGTVDAGAVYIYSGTNYATETKLVASDKAASDYFGYSVACSSDGSVVIVGANLSNPGGTADAGAVYVYSGTNYATETKLVASDKAASDYFGYSVACSSDGSVVVVGANESDPGGTSNAGAVYIYSGTNYATETKLVASDKAASDYFGYSVACSSDASSLLIGAFGADVGGISNAGAAYVSVPPYQLTAYYLTATASDIADQGTDEKKVWTSR